MLRPKNFRPFEIAILCSIALLLLGAGVVGVVLATQQGHWRLGVAGGGVILLAIAYLYAAWRGKPL